MRGLLWARDLRETCRVSVIAAAWKEALDAGASPDDDGRPDWLEDNIVALGGLAIVPEDAELKATARPT